jgi:protein-S-isoprenylcysteine O-methyltransferase Ste14
LGLDAAFAALFLGLLVPIAKDRLHIVAALLGAGIALALTPVHARRRAHHRRERRMPAGAEAMTEVWLVVALVGVGTVAIKAAGPVLLGGRPLPPRLAGVIDLLAPALFGALIAVQTFATGSRWWWTSA